MDSLKAFLKEKGLYLVCLGLILAATVASIWAIRNVMRGVEQLGAQENTQQGGSHMESAGYRRKQPGQRCAADYAGTVSAGICLVAILWGVVTICRRAGRIWQFCRVVRAAGRLVRLAGEW